MKNFTACCNGCGWRGSHFKLIVSMRGLFCPKCESDDIAQFGRPQTHTPNEIAKQFAEWTRNGLTNFEYLNSSIDHHFEVFNSILNTQTPNQMTQEPDYIEEGGEKVAPGAFNYNEKINEPMTQTKATTGKSIYLDGFIYEGSDGAFVPEKLGFINYFKNDPQINKVLCPLPHPFTNYQELQEGVDYVKQWQIKPGGQTRLVDVDEDVYNIHPKPDRCRIIAISIHAEKREGEEEERILCAAIWYKGMPDSIIQVGGVDRGVVLCGYRHGYIIHQFVALTGKRSVTSEAGEYVQGFLTTTNRFVDRKEAMIIAKKTGQVTSLQSFKELYSEDLY